MTSGTALSMMMGSIIRGSGSRALALSVMVGSAIRGSGTRAPALSILISPAIYPVSSGSPNPCLNKAIY